MIYFDHTIVSILMVKEVVKSIEILKRKTYKKFLHFVL